MFSISTFNTPRSCAQWRTIISANYCVDEDAYIADQIRWLALSAEHITRLTDNCRNFLCRWRDSKPKHVQIAQQFLQEYGLETQEGIVLMCIAEALLRIPDKTSARLFLIDKIHSGNWENHRGHSSAWLVNATSAALSWSDKLLGSPFASHKILTDILHKFGEPLLHSALEQAVAYLGDEFVFASGLGSAMAKAQDNILSTDNALSRCSYSFDLLGEGAISQSVADDYRQNYFNALNELHAVKNNGIAISENISNPYSLSIKLSALHPRYEYSQRKRVCADLIGNSKREGYLVKLARLAYAHNIPLTIDAEEADRLELSLDIIEKLLRHPALAGWCGFGMAMQAYSKRTLPALGFLNQLAQDLGVNFYVRLVKGAYWDSEIQWAQRAGVSGYPVFTKKAATDISYLACAKYLLGASNLSPQFATHNAHTILSILDLAKQHNKNCIEFQRLHGMGESIYKQLLCEHKNITCRIYAPVGKHAQLLPYLVRRLLENGANNSFVHQANNKTISIEKLAQHPFKNLEENTVDILPPNKLFITKKPNLSRRNSRGMNMNVESMRKPFKEDLENYRQHTWHACPVINGEHLQNAHKIGCTSPNDPNDHVGTFIKATSIHAQQSLDIAEQAFPQWSATSGVLRADCLEKISDLYEEYRTEFCALLIREAGKTITDALDEIREAIDFCRYYAQQAREKLMAPLQLPGPTGESNQLLLEGRGIFICISPWNFPLAIFTGQIVAALVTGNCVIAKPAQQTPLIACRAVECMLAAGIPANVLHFLPGSSNDLSAALTSDTRIAGIAFTGSTETAWKINSALANRNSSIATFIAETGGQNAMIADSTTLPEQLVKDVIRSAFSSAGQRCSALRVLFVQKDIAEEVINLLSGAMLELSVGNPFDMSTDVGPVIGLNEQQKLLRYIENMRQKNVLLAQTFLPENISAGYFVPPTLIEIKNINELTEEHFGPICHLICFEAGDIDQIIHDINNTGYGLTLGIHTRNEQFAKKISQAANVGNIYINRNMIGAVVGVQPFGGHGLSGTGPKAGGPHYLLRFVREKIISNNLAAVGGNIDLLKKYNSEDDQS